ncbi:MAG TPA: branched-chain amino acid ABC transporter permease [Acidimicrobiia bacterium]|nr:branched-chain amino acid ABC transporter permease [Acidimicrobiia bacterium]
MAATATGVYHRTYRRDFALRHTKAEYVRLALLAALAVILPFTLSQYWLSYVNLILLASIAAVGLNILTGYTGLVSLATAGFLGVGAYTTANITHRLHWPMPISVVLATLLAAAIGAFFGLPALRLKGLYLAISTFAAQVILSNRFRGWNWLTDGEGTIGAAYPSVIGRSDFKWYWLLLVIVGLVVWAGINLFRTGLGRAFIAIRDQDIAAEVMGVPVGRYKVLAFSIACGLAGLSGALQAHYRTIVTWENYEIGTSFTFVAMIIVGGLGSVSGAVYGAAFMTWLPAYITRVGQNLQSSEVEILRNLIPKLPAIQLSIFGLVLVVFLLFEPRGIARLWMRARDYFRIWPFRY